MYGFNLVDMLREFTSFMYHIHIQQVIDVRVLIYVYSDWLDSQHSSPFSFNL